MTTFSWKRRFQGDWRLGAVALVFAAGLGMSDAKATPDSIVGPDKCVECHKKTNIIWQKTHHFTTFKGLPRNKDAEKIADKMGIKRLKAASLCTDCHFTMQGENEDNAKAIAGISCESCHGAGKDYLKVHSEFSGKKEGQESPAEIAARWEKSEAGGMIRPKAVYSLAKNCFSCHLVPKEELVNVGGHAAGSDFELVAWSQGEVRHNVWYNKGKDNPEASQNRQRMMFVVGRIAEMETAMIGVSKATVKADYALKMAKRASNARKVVEALAAKLPEAPELAEIVAAAKTGGLKLNNEAELLEAAGKVSVLALKFANDYDGSTFGAIDKFIPGSKKFKGPVSN